MNTPARLLLLSLFFLFCRASAQTGALNFPNADYSWPRSTFKMQELPAILANIQSNSEYFGEYIQLHSHSMSYTYNPAFLNDSDRRMGAHFAKNAAFCALLNVSPQQNPDTLVTMTPTVRDSFIRKSLDLLSKMITTVEAFPNADPYIYRANELLDNVIAYDYLKAAGVPDSLLATAKGKLVEYAGNLFHEATADFFGVTFFSSRVNNFALRVCGALGMASIVLNDVNETHADRQASKWFHTAVYHMDNTLWKSGLAQSIPGQLAGYAEGPHYFRYGMKHALAFMKALEQFVPDTSFNIQVPSSLRTIRHPWYDSQYSLLWEWAARIRQPNGNLPAIEDSFADNCFGELCLLRNSGLFWPLDFPRMRGEWANSLIEVFNYSNDEFRPEYLASSTEWGGDTFTHFQVMPVAGNMVMRSGWDKDAIYLHMTGKHGSIRENAKGHNQGDATSFILAAFGEILALDPGYIHWNQRGLVSGPQHHSLILVDGQGPQSGSSFQGNDVETFLEHFFDLKGLDYTEARTSYNGADITRRMHFLHERYFICADRFQSAIPHTYLWQMQGAGHLQGDSAKGWLTADTTNGNAIYRRNLASLHLDISGTGTGLGFSTTPHPHELYYLVTEEHTAFQASQQADSNGQFLSILFPYPNGDTVCDIQKFSPATGVCAYRISQGPYHDLAVAQGGNSSLNLSPVQTGLSEDIESQAWLTIWSEDSTGQFGFFSVSGGNLLRFGNKTWYSSAVNKNLSLEKEDAQNYSGHVSDSGSVSLFIPFQPGSVIGWGLSSWTYNPADSMLHMQFWQDADFSIHQGIVQEISSEIHPNRIRLFPNPAEQGKFSVLLPQQFQTSKARLLVFDLNGKLILEMSDLLNQKEIPLDLGAYPQGVFIVEAVDEKGNRDFGKVICQ